MKKIAILLFVYLCTFSVVSAQEKVAETKRAKVEIGINCNSLLRNIFRIDPFKNGFPEQSFYLKILGKKKTALRLFGSFTASATQIENQSLRGVYQAIGSIGFERRTKVRDKWLVFWGIDATFKTADFKNAFPNVEARLGPVFGLYYMFNENFGLATEMTAFYSTENNFQYNIPRTIFLVARF